MANTSKPRYGSWLVTISLAIASVVYLMFSFLPTAREIKALDEQIHNDEMYAAGTAALTRSLAQTQAELDRTKAYLADWRRRLPTQGGVAALLARITRQADAAGAGMTRIEPQTPEVLDTLHVVPIVFGAKGTFAEIGRLLTGLESLPERVWLEDVKIDAGSQAGKDAKCTLRLAIFADNSEISD